MPVAPPKTDIVFIAFDTLDRPLGWGTDKVTITTPGYLRGVAKYNCKTGQTIKIMCDEQHVTPGEVIDGCTPK